MDGSDDDGEDDEAEHVVDDGGAEDDPGLGGVDTAQILEDAGRDADAGGGERGTEEEVVVDRSVRQKPTADEPAEGKGSGDPDEGDEERRKADGQDVAHGGLEAHLEKEDDDTQAGEELDAGILSEEVEAVEADQAEVAEDDADEELTEDRRLTGARGEIAAQHGGSQDDAEGEGDGTGAPMTTPGGERDRGCEEQPQSQDNCERNRGPRSRAHAAKYPRSQSRYRPDPRVESTIRNAGGGGGRARGEVRRESRSTPWWPRLPLALSSNPWRLGALAAHPKILGEPWRRLRLGGSHPPQVNTN